MFPAQSNMSRTAVFLAAVVILFVVFACREYICTCYQWYYLRYFKSLTREGAKTMLLAFDDAARESGLSYWLSEGTALGAVREGSYIEGDGDVDVGIFASQHDKLLHRVVPFLQRHHGVIATHRPLKTPPKPLHLLFPGIGRMDIDIVALGKPCMAIMWPRPCEEILPYLQSFRQARMYDRYFYVPQDDYLVRLYGADWRVPKPNFKPKEANGLR